MKHFPEALQNAFPCNLGRVAERPWWHRAPVIGAKMYRDTPTGTCEATTIQEAAEIDAKYPIPHPGYRAGQIWADDNGDSIVVMTCDDGEPHIPGKWWPDGKFAMYFPYLIADPACPHLAPWSPVENK